MIYISRDIWLARIKRLENIREKNTILYSNNFNYKFEWYRKENERISRLICILYYEYIPE